MSDVKILVAYQYFSFKGGIEHVIASQLEALDEQGHEVSLLTSSYLDVPTRELGPRIPIYRLSALNYLYDKLGIPFSIPFGTPRNVRRIKSSLSGVDVVIIHGHPYVFTLLVSMMARHSRVPIVLTQHNTEIRSDNRIIDTAYAVAERTIGRYNISRAQVVTVVSDETRRYVHSLAPHHSYKIKRIYNGIDSERFSPVSDRQAVRMKLGLPLDKFICFTVRRITFKNGIDTLLHAAELNDNPEVLFVLGGIGADLESARAFVAEKRLDNVRLMGSIADDDLPAYYAASDAFILPSRQGEGFPMVVLEAFASGLPVIATRSGGHVELIEEGETGYLVDTGDPVQINERITTLMRSDVMMMSKRCREIVQVGFKWQENVKQLLEAIEVARLTPT